MTELDQGPTHILDPSYGSLLIGVAFAIFFQGTLTVQAFNYYNNFPKDRLRIKATVAIVCALDTVHLILMFKGTYGFLITNWGFIPSLTVVPLVLDLHLIFTGLSVLVTQAFYIERIWIFSRGNIFIVAPIVVIAIVPLVLDFYMGILCVIDTIVDEYWRTKPEAAAMFVTGAVVDLLIALVTWYYLAREKTSFVSTRNIVTKAIQMVIATGLATAFIAIGAAIAFFVRGSAFYFIAVHMQLGRIYTNGLLASLNARQRHHDDVLHVEGETSFAAAVNSGDSRRHTGTATGKTNIVCYVKHSRINDEPYSGDHIHDDSSSNGSRENMAFEKPSGDLA
ncbi:hypothetical protein BJ165DRAFT_1614710 [Panaeolus papilionaceus]|nr:hypothetical protein BJ165DRAFT_1614710 [Panaeolus papilionaceus]